MALFEHTMAQHIEEPRDPIDSRFDEGKQLAGKVVEVLRALTKNQVIHWHDPLVFDAELYHGYVDIWAPIVCDPLEIGWAWTIDRGHDESSDLSLNVIVGPDETVEGQPAWRASTINRALERWAAEHAQRPDLRFASNTDLVSP